MRNLIREIRLVDESSRLRIEPLFRPARLFFGELVQVCGRPLNGFRNAFKEVPSKSLSVCKLLFPPFRAESDLRSQQRMNIASMFIHLCKITLNDEIQLLYKPLRNVNVLVKHSLLNLSNAVEILPSDIAL